MKRTLGLVLLGALWLLFAATPRPSSGTFVGGVTPTCSSTSGVCTLPDNPRAGTLVLCMNGIVQKGGEDYSIAGNTITPVPATVDLFADPTTVKVAFYVK